MIDVEDLATLTDEDREWLAIGRAIRKADPERYPEIVAQAVDKCEALEYLASRPPLAQLFSPSELRAKTSPEVN